MFKTANPVIASEAKQSILSTREKLDCFVATLLAMTAGVRQCPYFISPFSL
jgi:hypothetical protein